MIFKKIAWKSTFNRKARPEKKCFAEKCFLSKKVVLLCVGSIFNFLSEQTLLLQEGFCAEMLLVQCRS